MAKLDRREGLPRLLDVDDPPGIDRHRWCSRQLLGLRKRLFRGWRREIPQDADDDTIEHGVDDLLGLALLIEHLRRSGCRDLPTLSDVGKAQRFPTIASMAASLVESARSPFLAAVLEPDDFAAAPPVPITILDGQWERRLGRVTWLLFGDMALPLSFFGDFHQLCTGNPLTTESSHSIGPSMRQARGMFYTPAPIVDYLVWTSLSELLAGRSPDALSELRVLDPSCGCGAFLIACFRYFVHWHGQQLGDAGLARQHSIRLMEHCFSGCDIDARALRWTAQLLRLAAWQGTAGSADCSLAADRASIPDFKSTLSCRSFLEPVTACESVLPEPEYDAIIGGPPFVRLEALHRSQGDRLRYYRRRFLSASRGQFDLYMLFIEQALDMLKPGGLLAFSLSNSFLRSDSGRHIRGYIAANASVEEILELEDPRIYADAATQIVLLRLRKLKTRNRGRYTLLRGRGRLRQKLDHLVADRPHADVTIVPLTSDATATSNWQLSDRADNQWLMSIREAGVPLGQVVTVEYGQSTGMDAILLLKKLRALSPVTVIAQRRGEKRAIRFEARALRSVIRGHQLKKHGQYSLPSLYPFPFDDAGRSLSESILRESFPLTYAYLLSHRSALSARILGKGCPWHSTFVRLPRKVKDRGRLMASRITSTSGFRLIRDPMLLAHCSVVVLTPRSDTLDLYYLLGVLNSKVFARYVALTMPRINAGRFSLRLCPLRRFPIPISRFGMDEAASRRIASLVCQSLENPVGRRGGPDGNDALEDEVARLYGVAP